MVDISQTYCNHFIIYVNQTIMLYALNLYSDVCQWLLNETGKKNQNKTCSSLSESWGILIFDL